jgi:hypothetical protein
MRQIMSRRYIQSINYRKWYEFTILLNFDNAEEKTIRIIEVFMFFLCESYILRNLYHLLLCFLYEHLKFPASAFHNFNKE